MSELIGTRLQIELEGACGMYGGFESSSIQAEYQLEDRRDFGRPGKR